MTSKNRLDVELVSRGLAQSREKAKALILSGSIYVGNKKAMKVSDTVSAEDQIELSGAVNQYVSRGALKLEKALAAFHVDVTGVVAMDIGASTGGFTDVLLRSGASHVYAIDVGSGQLDSRLRGDERVTVMERVNARHLMPEDVPMNPTLGVMDVSFISITKILPAAFAILGEKGSFISLIKPQFEAGPERVGKKGVVRDAKVHEDVVSSCVAFIRSQGWEVQSLSYSPITGPEGNIEFLAYLLPASRATESVSPEGIHKVVIDAHNLLV